MQHLTNKQARLGKRHDKSKDKQPVWKGLWAAGPSQHAEFQLETLKHDAAFSLHVRRCFFLLVSKHGADPFLTPYSPWNIPKQDKSIIGTARQLEGGNREPKLKKDDEKFSCDPRTLLRKGVVVLCGVKFSRDFGNPKWLAPPAELFLNTTEDLHKSFFFFFFLGCKSAPPTPLILI